MDQRVRQLLLSSPPKPLLTAKEVAYASGYQPDTLRIYRSRYPDRLPFQNMGGRYFYKLEDVIKFIESLSPARKQLVKDIIR